MVRGFSCTKLGTVRKDSPEVIETEVDIGLEVGARWEGLAFAAMRSCADRVLLRSSGVFGWAELSTRSHCNGNVRLTVDIPARRIAEMREQGMDAGIGLRGRDRVQSVLNSIALLGNGQ